MKGFIGPGFLWTNDVAGTPYVESIYATMPKFMIAMSMGDTGGGSGGRQDYRKTVGFATSASSRWSIGIQAVDAAGTSACDKAQRADAVLTKVSAAGAVDARLDLSSFDPAGLTWMVDDAIPSTEVYSSILFTGTEITNVALAAFDQATATGNNDITTVGFQPDLVLILSDYGIAPEPDIRVAASVGFGACDASLNQWAYGSRALDAAATSDTGTYMKSGQVIGVPTASAGIGTCVVRASITSMLSNGFRLNYAEVDATVRRFAYLAVKGGRWKVGSLLSQTDTSTVSTVSLGWRPSGGLLLSAARAESTDDTPTAHDHFSLGFWGSSSISKTTEFATSSMAARDEDNQATTQVSVQLGGANSLYLNIDSATGFVNANGVLNSVTPDGFTLKMTDADAAQSFIGYVVGGEPITGVVGGGLLIPENG
jgi:hypothetical protein